MNFGPIFLYHYRVSSNFIVNKELVHHSHVLQNRTQIKTQFSLYKMTKTMN